MTGFVVQKLIIRPRTRRKVKNKVRFFIAFSAVGGIRVTVFGVFSPDVYREEESPLRDRRLR